MTPRETAEAYVRGKLPELIGGLKPGSRVRRGEGWPIDTIITLHVDFKVNAFDVLLCREGMNITFDLKDLNRAEVESWRIIGHPIQLQHWLRALNPTNQTEIMSNVKISQEEMRLFFHDVRFNLTTGQPATEEDYRAFNRIVGV